METVIRDDRPWTRTVVPFALGGEQQQQQRRIHLNWNQNMRITSLFLLWCGANFSSYMVASAFYHASTPHPRHFATRARVQQSTANTPSTLNSNSSSPNNTFLRDLYPPLPSFQNGTLHVDSIHTLQYQQYGSNSANAIPALFLHGGPGAGCFPRHAQFFDPNQYRIVLFDQRGSGRSTPRGEIGNNTIHHLLQDCEMLRNTLDIQQWGVVFGGSWGSTLALAYAQEHPNRVANLLLRGVCLLRPEEVDWMFGEDGVSKDKRCIDAWRTFRQTANLNDSDTDGTDRRSALHAHYDRLLSSDRSLQLGAARSWMQWEATVSSLSSRQENQSDSAELDVVLVGRPVNTSESKRIWGFRDPQGKLLPKFSDESPRGFKETLRKGLVPSLPTRQDSIRPRREIPSSPESSIAQSIPSQWAGFVPAQAILTCFYSVNDRYVMNNINLLNRVDRMQHIPCIAVHGGLDPVCPVDSALDLCKVYPMMELRIPLRSGHSMYDPAITNELVKATDLFAQQIEQTMSTCNDAMVPNHGGIDPPL